MADIIVNTDAIDELNRDMVEAKEALIGRLAWRGRDLLRDEVPEEMGNLKQGVARPEVTYSALEARLVVSAKSGNRGARVAEVFGADGKKRKTVTLRPTEAYNYAEVVARGNRDAVLTPKTAKAFLIPVPTTPTDEGYLLIGGVAHVVRRSRKGQKANPYGVRAAERLQKEAPRIGEAVLREFV